jgi:hypothetical protein
MRPLATLPDLEIRLGQTLVSAPEAARAEAALTDASSIIRAEANRQWDVDPVPDAIKALALRVARRLFLNPDGFAQETTGPMTYRVPDDAAGGMLTDPERRLMRAAIGALPAGSTRTPSGYAEVIE